MKTIHIRKGASLKMIRERISKITVFMPKTGSISSDQTHSFYADLTRSATDLESNFFRDAQISKFVRVETICNETLMLNTAHIICIELGDVVVLNDGCCFFLKLNEEFTIVEQSGQDGTTRVDFQI